MTTARASYLHWIRAESAVRARERALFATGYRQTDLEMAELAFARAGAKALLKAFLCRVQEEADRARPNLPRWPQWPEWMETSGMPQREAWQQWSASSGTAPEPGLEGPAPGQDAPPPQ